MEIGQNIRDRRKALNLTIEKLALEVGSDIGNISRIERGQQHISTAKISVFAKALHCTVADLIADSKSQNQILPLGYSRIPLLNINQITNWKEISSCLTQLIVDKWLITNEDVSPSSFALTIEDNSMSPVFAIGDKLIFDSTLSPIAGDFVVATNSGNELFFRKYQARGVAEDGKLAYELTPLNADYETLFSSNPDVLILGVMVEHRKYRSK